MDDNKKDLERNTAADKEDGAEPKRDYTAFIKAAADPIPEETEEERAKREAAETEIKKAIESAVLNHEKIAKSQERIFKALKSASDIRKPLIDTMQRMKHLAAFMGEWARETRKEQANFYQFLDDSKEEIARITGETPETIEELKEYLFEEWYNLLLANADNEEELSFIDLLNPNIKILKNINLNLFSEEAEEPFPDKEELIWGMVELAKKQQAKDQQDGQPEETVSDTLEIAEKASNLIRNRYNKGYKFVTTSTKLANTIFAPTLPKGEIVNGQREVIPVPYTNNTDGENATLYLDITYNEKELEKTGLKPELDDIDYFLSMVFDNLLLDGNALVSPTKVFHLLYDEKNSPTTDQINEILLRGVRGMLMMTTIDAGEIIDIWKYKNPKQQRMWKSPLMPIQVQLDRVTDPDSPDYGKLVNGEIHITALSPSSMVGNITGQLTTWDMDVLQAYTGRRTKRYFSVLRFLITEIGWMRNGTRSSKITYQNLYERTQSRTSRDKQLTKKMFFRLLEEVFKEKGYIASYKEDTSGEPGVRIKAIKTKAISGQREDLLDNLPDVE